jgi:hypothetical protein
MIRTLFLPMVLLAGKARAAAIKVTSDLSGVAFETPANASAFFQGLTARGESPGRSKGLPHGASSV